MLLILFNKFICISICIFITNIKYDDGYDGENDKLLYDDDDDDDDGQTSDFFFKDSLKDRK